MRIHDSAASTMLAPQLSVFRMTYVRSVGGVLLMAGALTACSDGVTGPEPTEPGATVRWNALARDLVIANRTAPPAASRAYAYLSVAQYAAALSAHGLMPGAVPSLTGLRGQHTSPGAAVASASARILVAIFPGEVQRIEGELSHDLSALRAQSREPEAIDRGVALGTAIASSLEIRARLDGWDAPWTGTLPNGAGFWTGTSPELPNWGQVRPWLWRSGSDLRAPPPPAFESQAFLDALAEVYQIAQTRTPEQMDVARLWADGAGTYTPAGHWNAIAEQLIRESGMSELNAARTMALMNVAIADAFIGCWDSKFTYWVVRPWQADPAITTPIGRPPHPSYPSGHACGSSAGAHVLSALFPAEAAELERMAVEACDSRVYAGIHYRFDAEAGMTIGTRAAERALGEGDQLVRSELTRALARADE